MSMSRDWLEGIDFSGLDEDKGGEKEAPTKTAAEHLREYAAAHPDMTAFIVARRTDTEDGYAVAWATFNMGDEDAHYAMHRLALNLLVSSESQPPEGK